MPYVDTHCHLDHHEGLSVAEQVERARAAGVGLMITIGTDMASSTQAVSTARRFDDVHACVGIHPNDAMEASPRVLEVIERLTEEPEVVAVGETGLDYYRDHTTPQQQSAAFRAHIDLAREHDKTLVIHCREAWADCLAILEDATAPPRVVMHCFSGDVDVAKRCADRGWFLSFAGTVTFGNATSLRDALAATPMRQVLVETDAPYLTPHPYRGRPNGSYLVPITVREIARVQDMELEAVCAALSDNTTRAFGTW